MKSIKLIIRCLRKHLKKSKPIIQQKNAFRILISTVLSQRCRDANTELASKQLFAKFKTPKQLANAKLSQIEELIKPSGFYKVKAKRLKHLSKELLDRFNGRVPNSLNELLSLPGVGRKTANCVLVYAFKIPAIPVDVHVHRISNRIGLIKTNSPEKSEKELIKIVPKHYWIELNHLMVRFGQSICLARNPKCKDCCLKKLCEFGLKKLKGLK